MPLHRSTLPASLPPAAVRFERTPSDEPLESRAPANRPPPVCDG